MPSFVAFLRAVNVGKRQYPMAELRSALADAGFEDVQTHIQTGNVLLRTGMRSPAKVTAAVEKAMLADRGFAVPVVLMTPAELSEANAEAQAFRAEYAETGGQPTGQLTGQLTGHYLTLLATPPDRGLAAEVEAQSRPGEQLRVGRRAVHLLLAKPYHEVAAGNGVLERRLGVATTRNLTVISKLTEKWCP